MSIKIIDVRLPEFGLVTGFRTAGFGLVTGVQAVTNFNSETEQFCTFYLVEHDRVGHVDLLLGPAVPVA